MSKSSKSNFTDWFLIAATIAAVLGIGFMLIIDQPIIVPPQSQPAVVQTTDSIKNNKKPPTVKFDAKKYKDSLGIKPMRRK